MTREKIEWANLWWENADDYASPRVLVIGDSITNGYRGMLQEKLRPHGILVDMTAGSRSVEDPAFFRELEYVLGTHQNYKYRVIHFNNGLHGGHLTKEQYAEGYSRAVELIRSLHPEAVVILTTSTCYTPKGSEGRVDTEANASVLERNDFLREYSAAQGLPLDDLFTVTSGKAEYPQPDGVHFTSAGYDALSTAAASKILEYFN